MVTPEKAVAYLTYKKALRNGAIVRCSCQRCGAASNIHGHHPNYKEPLNVMWLCSSCHSLWHAVRRAVETAARFPHNEGCRERAAGRLYCWREYGSAGEFSMLGRPPTTCWELEHHRISQPIMRLARHIAKEA